MKLLKYLLGIALSLVLIFLLIGRMKPTVNYGHTIVVNKSVQEAWNIHKDDSKYDQWLEGFKSMELLSGEKEQVGSTYRVIVNPGEGQEDFEMIETVVGLKEYEYVDLSFDSDMMVFEQKTLFKELGGQTSITTESKCSGKGWFMRSMFAIMEMIGGSFQKQEEKNLEALKKLIDAS